MRLFFRRRGGAFRGDAFDGDFAEEGVVEILALDDEGHCFAGVAAGPEASEVFLGEGGHGAAIDGVDAVSGVECGRGGTLRGDAEDCDRRFETMAEGGAAPAAGEGNVAARFLGYEEGGEFDEIGVVILGKRWRLGRVDGESGDSRGGRGE
jgi:hypothetical protein